MVTKLYKVAKLENKCPLLEILCDIYKLVPKNVRLNHPEKKMPVAMPSPPSSLPPSETLAAPEVLLPSFPPRTEATHLRPGAPSRTAATPRNPREKGKRGGGAVTHRRQVAGGGSRRRRCALPAAVALPPSSPFLPLSPPVAVVASLSPFPRQKTRGSTRG
jgi:hypothetical protein